MFHVDLAFAVRSSQPIPIDHGYALYGAVSRLLPNVHQENNIALHPIRGRMTGERRMSLMSWSRLTVRVSDAQIASVLPLVGKSIPLGDAPLRIGVPEVHALISAPTLRSRLVVVKAAHVQPAKEITEERFIAAVRKQLESLGVSPSVNILIPRRNAAPDKPRRRTLRIHHREIAGYEVILEGLTAEESLTVQSHPGQRGADGKTWTIPAFGLGGKRHMGCGVFTAVQSVRAGHVS